MIIATYSKLKAMYQVLSGITGGLFDAKIHFEEIDKLFKTTTELQVLVNSALNKSGALTLSQYDTLDEQVRKAKLQLLAAENKATTRKYIFYGVGVIVGLSALWYITKDKK
jgi:hypothetical protein